MLAPTALGGSIAVSATGPGDGGIAVTRTATIVGRNVRPPAPIGLRACRMGDGTIRIAWTRRSRAGWAWLDGADIPLGEDDERYRLSLTSDGTTRIVETASATFDYAAADQTAGLSAGTSALAVSIAQLGRFGTSDPAATAMFTL